MTFQRTGETFSSLLLLWFVNTFLNKHLSIVSFFFVCFLLINIKHEIRLLVFSFNSRKCNELEKQHVSEEADAMDPTL